MGYQMANGRFARTKNLTLVDTVAVTATGAVSGSAVELGDKSTLRLTLNVTAVAGTSPSATFTIETSQDNSTWSTVASFSAATSVSTQRKVFTGLDKFVRVNVSAFSGSATPSVTATISGDAA